MRRLLVALLVIGILGSGVVYAQRGPAAVIEEIAAVAWIDGDELHVAVGNSSYRRITVTISTNTLDSRGRPVFSSRQVSIPARTIVQETFYPNAPRRNEQINLRIAEGVRGFRVPVQQVGAFQVESYVVQANTQWKTTVNLDALLDDSGRTRLVIDDYYTTADGFNQDRIHIESVGGGPTQVRGTNTIEYVKPYLVLRMKTPNISGMTTMTFGVRKVDTTASWRQERVEGPILLVYGRNMRFAGESGGTGRIITR